jgi:hypothetical protein
MGLTSDSTGSVEALLKLGRPIATIHYLKGQHPKIRAYPAGLLHLSILNLTICGRGPRPKRFI